MWIGTSTNLFLLDRNSGKYHEIPLPGGATYIYTLHQENNGLLYIGTSGSGLFTYDPVKESISAHYHTENSPLVSKQYLCYSTHKRREYLDEYRKWYQYFLAY